MTALRKVAESTMVYACIPIVLVRLAHQAATAHEVVTDHKNLFRESNFRDLIGFY